MFKVEVRKEIYRDTDKTDFFELLIRKVELPFPPYVGLSIVDGRFHSGEILSVEWCVDKNVFRVMTSDEVPWQTTDLDLMTAEMIAKHLIKRGGWSIPDDDPLSDELKELFDKHDGASIKGLK